MIKTTVFVFFLLISGTLKAAPQATMSRGAYLAKVGNCMSCHTTEHGKQYAGGLAMMTPVGAIFTTNITPDKTTGIGGYSLEDFTNAMRKGIAKDGHYLYPAMPYPSYSKINQSDMQALYDYFMNEVAPVNQANRASEIPWPLNARWPLAIWNALFLNDEPYKNDTEQSDAWNRGAYLVQGLGHCGACHTPRGLAFQEKGLTEKDAHYLLGGVVNGWSASSLVNDHNTGLKRWSVADIYAYLKFGANQYSASFGSMTEVVNNSTQYFSDQDINAIANYLKALPSSDDKNQPTYEYRMTETQQQLSHLNQNLGAAIYDQYCLSCHGADGKGAVPNLAPLAGNPAVLDPDPSSLINVTLNGSKQLRISGITAPYNMPGFRDELNDQEVAAVVSFMQSAWNHNLPATSTDQVAEIRALETH